MNILFYQYQYPAFGGIETVTTLLANQFAKDGHNVKIISFVDKGGTTLLAQLQDNVSWERLPEAVINASRNKDRLAQVFDEFQPDYVIFQDSYAPIEDLIFSVAGGKVPVFVVEHSMPRVAFDCSLRFDSSRALFKSILVFLLSPYFWHKHFVAARMRRRKLYQLAGKYVFLSDRYIARSNRITGIYDCDKLLSIPNPIVPHRVTPDLPGKRKEVLFCGSLIKLKGVARLLKIWSAVAPIHPDWTFRIVGDGPLRGPLEDQVRLLGLENVRFEGAKTDVECYYHNASILLLASDFEGWPMVLGEAMQQGCVPIVYDSFDALFDIVEDGKSGRIIKYRDSFAFSSALNELMSNADKIAMLQCGAIEKAKEYDLETIVRRWYALGISQSQKIGDL